MFFRYHTSVINTQSVSYTLSISILASMYCRWQCRCWDVDTNADADDDEVFALRMKRNFFFFFSRRYNLFLNIVLIVPHKSMWHVSRYDYVETDGVCRVPCAVCRVPNLLSETNLMPDKILWPINRCWMALAVRILSWKDYFNRSLHRHRNELEVITVVKKKFLNIFFFLFFL